MKTTCKYLLSAMYMAVMGMGTAGAATINGGSTLLNNPLAAQLETWLGQGSIALTNIFTRQSNNTTVDFHAAADGKGATFSVVGVRYFDQGQNSYANAIIGGYNPQSWDSSGNWHFSFNAADRTAFIFNLTTGTRLNQSTDYSGSYQTMNYSGYGPTFGGGFDLGLYSLGSGEANQLSYGNPTQNVFGGSSRQLFWVTDLEVFTIAPTQPVPEPETYAMLLAGLGVMGAVARRRARQAA